MCPPGSTQEKTSGYAGGSLLAERNPQDRAGLLMHGGSAVDAPIVEAPSSTKNAKGGRDPEMHRTKKGGQYYFGMKVHAAVDAGTGYAVAAAFAPANVHDICEPHGLVREGDPGLRRLGLQGLRQAPRDSLRPAPGRRGLEEMRGALEEARAEGSRPGGGEAHVVGARARRAPLRTRQAHLRLLQGEVPRHREERREDMGAAGQRKPALLQPAPAGRGSSWRPRPSGRPAGVARDAPPGP